MSAALSLILIVVAAYLAAHVLFDWVARKYQIVSGAEYLVLGILLGPHVGGVLSAEVIKTLAPFTTLALGWAAAALGMKLFVPELIGISSKFYKVAVIEATATFLFVSSLMLFAFAWALDLTYGQVILPAISLGAIATATATAGHAPDQGEDPHPVVTQLKTSALVDGTFAILAFGILLCVGHIDVSAGGRFITASEWGLISVAIGVASGALFHLFIGNERNVDRLFLSLAGVIVLCSGAAAYLRLSPLMPCLLLGATLANTAGNRPDLQRLMDAVEKPLYFVLLLLAGLSWSPSQYSWILPVVLYIFVRTAAKLGSARLATRAVAFDELRDSNWGSGLLGQGTIALGIAMSYSLNDMQIVPNIVSTAAVMSVLVTDLFGIRIVSLLVRPPT